MRYISYYLSKINMPVVYVLTPINHETHSYVICVTLLSRYARNGAVDVRNFCSLPGNLPGCKGKATCHAKTKQATCHAVLVKASARYYPTLKAGSWLLDENFSTSHRSKSLTSGISATDLFAPRLSTASQSSLDGPSLMLASVGTLAYQ